MGACLNSQIIERDTAFNTALPKDSQDPMPSTNRKHLKRKAQIVDSRPISEYEDAPSAIVSNRKKTIKEQLFISQALSKHFLFKKLPHDQVGQILDQMQHY